MNPDQHRLRDDIIKLPKPKEKKSWTVVRPQWRLPISLPNKPVVSVVVLIHMSILPACVHSAQIGEKKASDSLEMEIETEMSPYVGPGN